MINLDKLYLEDLPKITKEYIIENAPHDDEQFSALMYLTKVARGISYIVDGRQLRPESINSYLIKKNITKQFYFICIDSVAKFHLVTHHQIKISLIRIHSLIHSNLDLSALATVDILALSKLPLADFKAFVTASNEVKH